MLAGCVMSTAGAETDRATVRVLNAFGCAVSATEGQQCCGALHLHNGDMERARALAKTNIAAFEADPAEAIIVNAAGCGSAMKGYGHWLHEDPEWADRAMALSERVRDLSEYLATLPAPGARPVDATVVFQEACHLAHAQRIRQAPKQLLRAIPGLQVREMAEPALRCGSAGVYNLTHPESAERLGARKAKNIRAAAPDRVISSNPGCILQIRASLARDSEPPVTVQHIADLLDEAYGGATPAARSPGDASAAVAASAGGGRG
jgi:glycolate oxidase iron-sulfur subunit